MNVGFTFSGTSSAVLFPSALDIGRRVFEHKLFETSPLLRRWVSLHLTKKVSVAQLNLACLDHLVKHVSEEDVFLQRSNSNSSRGKVIVFSS